MSTPFDLGTVMRRVHFAYRQKKEGEFAAGHGTYAVRVRGDGTVSIRPFHHPPDGASREAIRGEPIRLQTIAVARGSENLVSSEVSARVEGDGSLTLSREAVVERLENGVEGVEQSWAFERRPEGSGELVVRVKIEGMAYAGRSTHGLHFEDPKTGLGIRYGWGTWVDATGNRWQLESRFDDGTGSVSFRVPATVVDGCTYPALLDPVLMPEFDLNEPAYSPPLNQQQFPSVAFNGVDTYLVVWQDDRGGGWDIQGARVDAAGEVLDPLGISISTAGGAQQNPVVDFDGNTFFVVWQDKRGPNWNIYGARIDPTTWTVLDPDGIAISTAGNDQANPEIAHDAANFMVVWQDMRNGNWDIYGSRINSQGTVQDAAGIAIFTQTNDQQLPALAHDEVNTYLVVWQDSGADWNIFGTRVDTAGNILDTSGIPISPAPNNQQNPDVAFDGTQYLVVWQDIRTGTAGTRWDIYGARLDDQGIVQEGLGIPISKYDNDQQDQLNPQVAYDGTSHFMVVWQDNRLGTTNSPVWDIYGARVNASGSVVDTPSLPLAQENGYQQRPVLAWGTTHYLLVWADYRWGTTSGTLGNIYGTLMDNAGDLDLLNIPVSTDLNAQKQPAVAYDGGSKYLVVWSEYTTGDYGPSWDLLYAQVKSSGLVEANGIVSDAARDQQEAVVIYGGGQFLVAWSDSRNSSANKGWDIYGARVSLAGVLLDPDGVAYSSENKDQRFPAVAFDGTNYMVVWQDSRGTTTDIYGTRIALDGEVQDVAGINVYSGGAAQERPAIAFDGTRYLVVWQDKTTGAWDIVGRRVDPDSSLLDSQGIPVSFYTADQQFPALVFDGDYYVVAWQDKRNGAWDIFATQVRPADGLVLNVNGVGVSTAEKDQRYPNIGFDGINTLVVWEDFRDGAIWEIYGARITPQLVVGDNLGFIISEAGNTNKASPGLASNGNGGFLVAYERGDTTSPYGTVRVTARMMVTRAQNGVDCALDIDCISGWCSDELCCNAACGGGDPGDCQACSTAAGAASDGVCGTVTTGVICRPADGLCDVAESCTGSSTTCPVDAVETVGAVCRPVAGDCDVEEKCDGITTACPADIFMTPADVCRPAAGDCDVAESCTGLSADCPADALEGAGVVCRISGDECDPEESCNGVDPTCPVDELASDDTPCTNGTCIDGVCVPEPDMGIPDIGADALTDAGTDAIADTAEGTDSGAEAGEDLGLGADAGAGVDATGGEGGQKSLCFGPNCENTGSGCSCHLAPDAPAPNELGLLILLGGLLLCRRRFRG